jgi:hypothetical protein
MKNLKTTITVLAFSIFAISCSKSDDKPSSYQEENFLQGYINNAGLVYQNEDGGVQYRELAFTFKPLVKGKINAINVKTPQTSGEKLYYKIWDKATNALIKPLTEINGHTANTNFNFPIDPIVLEKNKEYIFVLQMTNWRVYKKTDNSDIVYPITVGNIVILDKLYKGTQANSISEYNSDLKEYYGDFSFNFQRTE